MTQRLIIRAEAEADIAQAALWYEQQQADLGTEFLAEISVSLECAAINPRQFPRFRRTPEVRRILVNRFPYRIFFIHRPDAIIVFRVLHGARREGEWKRNVPKE